MSSSWPNVPSPGQDSSLIGSRLHPRISVYGGHQAGSGTIVRVNMPNTVHRAMTKMSESTGENMFALAVLMHLDRMHQLRGF